MTLYLKRFGLFVFASFFMLSCSWLPGPLVDALSGATSVLSPDGNSLFHQTPEHSMKPGSLEVMGEVEKPGKIRHKDYYKREVVLRQARRDQSSGEVVFDGAYRYRGYSLFDLLHGFQQDKKNRDIFRPAIDLYILVENDAGESVVFSFSEIFHVQNPHQVLIATESAPIVPYRVEVDYPVNEYWTLVSAQDLFAHRMLENPSRIRVLSFDEKEYTINRDLDPLYSPFINVVMASGHDSGQETLLQQIDASMAGDKPVRYYHHFYGMGMGNHPTPWFEGPRLEDVLENTPDGFDPEWNRHGLLCFAGIDGYRAVFSHSELFNRTDQVSALLAIPGNPENGGHFRIFHPGDFYADRSVKSVGEIYFFMP